MKSSTIVIATPHARNDPLVQALRQRLQNVNVVRLRSKDELTLETLKRLKPDFVFFPHWSWKIPERIFTRFDCVIFHMTDLPYGRGGSPLQNLIARGHGDTVLSALKCAKDVDAGPIYLKRPLSLEGTAEEILTRASVLMESIIVDIVQRRPAPVPQEGDTVQFERRRPEDGDLGPLSDLGQVNDYIRMLDADGYPPAFLETDHLRLEFSDARFANGDLVAKVRFKKIDD